MNDREHEELLIRLDERTKIIKESIEKIIEHQEDQNGYLRVALADIKGHETSINFLRWIGGGFATAFLAFVAFFINHIIRN